MSYRGTYKNGIVILDEPTNLPDGQRVQVDVHHDDAENPPITALPTPQMQELLKISGMLNSGRSDGSCNHDHYISGAPKREAAE